MYYIGVLDMDSVTQTRVVGTDYHFSLSSLNYLDSGIKRNKSLSARSRRV